MLLFLLDLPQLFLLAVLIFTHFSSNSDELKEKYNLTGYLITHVFNTVIFAYIVLWVASIFLPVAFLVGWANLALDVIAIVWLWQSWKDGKVQAWWVDVKAVYTSAASAIKSLLSRFGK